MRNLLLLVIMLHIINENMCFSQAHMGDTIFDFKQITQLEISDYEKADKYREFALKYRVSRPHLSIKCLEEALKIYELNDAEQNVGVMHSMLANLYAQIELYDISAYYITNAYKVYKNSKMDTALAWIITDMGNIYFRANRFDEAAQNYKEANVFFEKQNFLLGMSVIQLNFGLLQEKKNNVDSALYFFNRCLKIREDTNDVFLIAHIYFYIARANSNKENFDDARELLHESNRMIKTLGREFDLYLLQKNANYILLANTYEKENNFATAISYADSALYYALLNTDTINIIKTYMYLGELYSKFDKPKEAIKFYENSLEYIDNKLVNSFKSEIYYHIANMYLRLKNFEETAKYFNLHMESHEEIQVHNDSIKNTALALALENYLRKIEMEEIEKQGQRKNRTIALLIITFLTLTIILVLFFIIKNRIFKSNRALINAAFEGIIVHKNGLVFDINDSFIKFSGYALKELKNQNINGFLNVEAGINDLKSLQKNHKKFSQTSIKLKDGSFTEIEIENHLIRYYGRTMILTTIKDISERIKANAQIQLFKTIIEQNFSPIIITDEKGAIEYVNPSFSKLTGYTLDEAVGKTPRILRSDFHDDDYYKKLWEDVSSGIQWNGIFKNIDKNGNYFWEEAHIGPIKDHAGKIIKYVAIKQDITEKMFLEAEIKLFGEKLKRIFETIDSAVFVIDYQNGIIKTSNIKAQNIFGELENRNINEVFSEKDIREKVIPMDLLIAEDKNPSQERKIVRNEIYYAPKGIWYELRMRSLKWVDGSRAVLVVAHDITDIKNTIEKLNEVVATKDKFFSIISHDLKNPFQGLMGFSEMLLTHKDLENLPTVKMIISLIYNTSKNSFKLLENLLEWANLQKGITNIKKQKFDLYTLIPQSLELKKSTFSHKNITVDNLVPKNTFVCADKHVVSTVLRNLLSNAFKFTPSNGHIFINAEEQNEKVIISIKDTGVGIPQEMISKLFRVETKYSVTGTEGEMGNGIGLILCKELLIKMGSDISVESKIDAGTTFSFDLEKADGTDEE